MTIWQFGLELDRLGVNISDDYGRLLFPFNDVLIATGVLKDIKLVLQFQNYFCSNEG